MNAIDKARIKRKRALKETAEKTWEYVVIGSGITGAQTFRVLAAKGYKVLMIDAGDFSSGTSSSSGMLIWGGLLYLKHLDFKSVFKFSISRDRLIKQDKENVKVLPVSYLTDKSKPHAGMALWLYWLFSMFRRKRPSRQTRCTNDGMFLRKYKYQRVFEEAIIRQSDSRYVMDLILHSLTQSRSSRAFNYLELVSGKFNYDSWTLRLSDKIQGNALTLTANNVINCAGISTDVVNQRLDVHDSPYRHLWSKGVYLNLVRDKAHQTMFIFDDPEKDDVMTFCPVGKVSFFGPTEDNIDKDRGAARELTHADITQLKQKYEVCTGKKLNRHDVVSFRMGVRPLCVPKNASHDEHTLSISRNSNIHHVPSMNFAAVYGGKFTGSYMLAKRTAKLFGINNVPLEQGVPASQQSGKENSNQVDPQTAVLHEQCWTLKDYLRNRTFVNQSVPNGGFGINFEFKEKLENLSMHFADELASLDVSLNAYLNEQVEIDELFNEVFDVS